MKDRYTAVFNRKEVSGKGKDGLQEAVVEFFRGKEDIPMTGAVFLSKCGGGGHYLPIEEIEDMHAGWQSEHRRRKEAGDTNVIKFTGGKRS